MIGKTFISDLSSLKGLNSGSGLNNVSETGC